MKDLITEEYLIELGFERENYLNEYFGGDFMECYELVYCTDEIIIVFSKELVCQAIEATDEQFDNDIIYKDQLDEILQWY